MSTRYSMYYEEDGGVHIYYDFMFPEVPLFLEFSRGPFSVDIPLSEKLALIIKKGIEAAQSTSGSDQTKAPLQTDGVVADQLGPAKENS